ncbi:MAG: DUF4921 family protein [Myxococcales bacterium]|nr:DUF4921 family protein [Myxococcales bacterium]
MTNELRKDPILDRWSLFAPQRNARPNDFVSGREPRACPFCEGNEGATPPERFALRAPGTAPDTPGWRARVVPNLYPAFTPRSDLVTREEGLLQVHHARGEHEVVIATPRHVLGLADLAEDEVRDYFRVVQARIRHHHREGAPYVLLMTNRGRAAGASLEHVHGQIAAMPMVPTRVAEEIEAAVRHAAGGNDDIFGRLLDTEREEGARIVAENDLVTAFVPFAARFAAEVWFVPRVPGGHFARADDALRDATASLLRRVLHAFDLVWDRPAYNFFLHDGAPGVPGTKHFRWHIELFGVFGAAMSFEAGTGCFINLTLPEQTAAALREAAAKLDEGYRTQ